MIVIRGNRPYITAVSRVALQLRIFRRFQVFLKDAELYGIIALYSVLLLKLTQ